MYLFIMYYWIYSNPPVFRAGGRRHPRQRLYLFMSVFVTTGCSMCLYIFVSWRLCFGPFVSECDGISYNPQSRRVTLFGDAESMFYHDVSVQVSGFGSRVWLKAFHFSSSASVCSRCVYLSLYSWPNKACVCMCVCASLRVYDWHGGIYKWWK